jgi:nucleotide-binding universal stress UspA family protein
MLGQSGMVRTVARRNSRQIVGGGVATTRLVVGVDGSPSSEQALEWALREARLRKLPLNVVAAWWPPGEQERIEQVETLTSVEQLRSGIRERLVATVDAVAQRSGGTDVVVEPTVVYGHPAQKLVDASGSNGLLTVGSRGRGGVTGALLGSVSQNCAQYARSSVCVVRGRLLADGPGRIVVGIDGSPASLTALRFAAETAALRGSVLHAVHTWIAPYHATSVWSPSLPAIDESRDAAATTLRDSLSAGLGDKHGLRVEHSVIEGPAGPTLVEAAGDADLLVVGSRGRGGWKALLLGSVSTHCVVNAPGPVVIAREP